MTVCITGDVHHMSMGTRDQEYMDRTEVEAALEYAELAANYDVPVTLFCTGKCIAEERDLMERLAGMDNVELGGHNYWAFTTPVHDAWRAVEKVTGGRVGSWNGPRPFQAWEVGRTVSAFANIGADITAWRDHAYRHDGNTISILCDHGITHFSDAVGPDEQVRREGGTTVVPVNTPPDHEHVYHAFRTSEFVAEDNFEGPFGSDARQVDEWFDWVLDAVERHSADLEPATVLAHPACMDLADGLDTFEHLCRVLGERPTVTLSTIMS